MDSISEKKKALREKLKLARAGLQPGYRRQSNTQIIQAVCELPQIERANSVFCFVSMTDEVDSHPLIQHWLAQGKRTYVPRITHTKTMIAVELVNWEQLQPGELGILTPQSTVAYEGAIDVCITPGLGFTKTGKRIGFGRGYYDKWFARNPDTARIALAYECQIIDDIPTDENDVRVDMIITEQGILNTDNT